MWSCWCNLVASAELLTVVRYYEAHYISRAHLLRHPAMNEQPGNSRTTVEILFYLRFVSTEVHSTRLCPCFLITIDHIANFWPQLDD